MVSLPNNENTKMLPQMQAETCKLTSGLEGRDRPSFLDQPAGFGNRPPVLICGRPRLTPRVSRRHLWRAVRPASLYPVIYHAKHLIRVIQRP